MISGKTLARLYWETSHKGPKKSKGLAYNGAFYT